MSKKSFKNRIATSYISTVIGISLVLFFIGLFGLLLINTTKLSNYYKEQIRIEVYLKDSLSTSEVAQIEKQIAAKEYTKSTEYISKQEAEQIFQEIYGEDFTSFLGVNVLPASLNIYLKANYVNQEQIESIIANLQSFKQVTDIRYQKSLVQSVNENAKKIGTWILVLSFVLILLAVGLINNTVRLAIYSKRFLIRSMQLVGATSRFIRKPFLVSGMIQGLISAVLAMMGLLGVASVAINQNPVLKPLLDVEVMIILAVLLILIGITFTYYSTFWAVRKYLRIQPDKLF